MKKNLICKEKSGSVTKVKLVSKSLFSFTLELWYQYHIVIVEITHKIRTSFKTLASKKAAAWQFKSLRVTINFHEK